MTPSKEALDAASLIVNWLRPHGILPPNPVGLAETIAEIIDRHFADVYSKAAAIDGLSWLMGCSGNTVLFVRMPGERGGYAATATISVYGRKETVCATTELKDDHSPIAVIEALSEKLNPRFTRPAHAGDTK